jgi:Protein of unknown function (DUF2806)
VAIDRELRATDIASSVRKQWLDKLWLCLFDTNSGGLMSPGQIRRERRDRDHVRQLEMAAILDAESEINDIHHGTKSLDDHGNLIDTPLVETVSTHRIIENTVIEQDADIGLDSPAMMIRSAVKEVSVRDLERSLNLKKIAILAESEILEADITPVSSKPVNAEWMVRWRESAEDVFNPELQVLWARMLVREIAQPGRYTFGVMAVLHQLNHSDIETLLVVAKYTFPGFIYNACDSYFNTDFHRGLFEELEELSLFSFNAANQITLPSQQIQSYLHLLICRNKALKVTAHDHTSKLKLPIIKLNRVGRQLFELTEADTDLAYLFDLANHAKAQGFDVALGDWINQGVDRGRFDEKMKL